MKMSSGAENADVKYSNLLSAEANKLNRFASSQLNSSYTQLDIADTANRNSRKRVTESEVQAAAIHEISEVCTKLLTISDEYRTLLINAFGVSEKSCRLSALDKLRAPFPVFHSSSGDQRGHSQAGCEHNRERDDSSYR